MPDKNPNVCGRCGAVADRLYDFNSTDEEDGEEIKMKICWDCDHDIINGGDPFEDAANIYQDRKEEAYAYDPINNPSPY